MRSLMAAAALLLTVPAMAFAEPTAPHFQVSDDGQTVTDQRTGLQWMRCSLGQNWTGTTCSGFANRYTWDQAVSLSSNHAGLDGWRLPAMEELQYLVEYSLFNPAIDSDAFPNTPVSNFWSSTEAAFDAFYAWSVNFANGFSNWRHKRQRFEARLVRNGD